MTTRDGTVLLLVTHLDAGGAQETLIALAAGLPQRGFEVTVAARPGGTEAGRISALGVELVSIPSLRRAVHPIDDLRAYRSIKTLLVERGFDVVHTHSSKAGVLGRVGARGAGTPVVVHTSHGLPINPDMTALERTLLLAAERRAARFCDRVVAVSRATAAELRDLRLADPDQIAVIPSGVAVERFSRPTAPADARRLLGLPTDAPVIGWIGRYFPQKRPDLVVRAARRILNDVPDAIVVMVGDGPTFAATRSEASDEPRIRFLGFRDDMDVVYAALDVMLLASAWEGLPRTIIEAHAAGVPVVTTDVSGISEVVADGETGFTVRPGDWRSLAARATLLLRDERLRERFARAARAAVSDDYSDRRMIDATADLYREVLSQKGHRSR